MHPLLTATAKVPRSTDPGALLVSILEAIQTAQVPLGAVRFLVSHDDARVLDRIKKAEPVLAAYEKSGTGSNTMLTGTIELLQGEGRDVFEALCRVGTGISRRFRVGAFTIAFVRLDWGAGWLRDLPGGGAEAIPGLGVMFGQLAQLGAIADLSSAIVYRNAWWVSGRDQSIEVRLIADVRGDENAKPPAVGEHILGVVQKFAKLSAKRFKLTVLPTIDAEEDEDEAPETAVREADRADLSCQVGTLRESAIKRMRELCTSGALPHVLEETPVGAIAERETGVPKRQIIAGVLRPRGYGHQGKLGGQGLMVFGKLTASNTKVVVTFDFGTWMPRIEPMLTVSGANWRVSLPLQFRATTSPLPYTPPTREAFAQALENIAAVLDYLETSFVAPLEGLLGASPAWTAQF